MISINSKALAVEDLSFPFNSDSGRYWQYISDQVMGGISDGEVTLSKMEKCIMQDLQVM